MADIDKKCAHNPCVCSVAADKEFCSDSCEDAGDEEVEIACESGHKACAE